MSSTFSNLEREDHQRDADFNKAMHGQSSTASGGVRAMLAKRNNAAQKAAVDEYFRHWDNKAAKDETVDDRAVSDAEAKKRGGGGGKGERERRSRRGKVFIEQTESNE